MYTYNAQVIKVVDGDTLRLDIDLGLDISTRHTVRLLGINAPEMSTPEGKVARGYMVALLQSPNVTVRTVKATPASDKYGRYLAQVVNANGVDVSQAMLDAGQAVAYNGGAR